MQSGGNWRTRNWSTFLSRVCPRLLEEPKGPVCGDRLVLHAKQLREHVFLARSANVVFENGAIDATK